MKTFILTGFLIFIFLFSYSTTLTVSNTADSGMGSLREAIATSSAGDTIQFAISSPDSIVLTTELILDKNLVIVGPGSEHLAISGGGSSNILFIQAGSQIFISGLTLRNAELAVLNEGGTLEMVHCTISNNRKGILNGHSIGHTSKLILNYAKVLDNYEGGGIANLGVNGDTSILVVNNSIISGNINTLSSGGGIRNTTEDGGTGQVGIAYCYVENSAIINNRVISQIPSAAGGGVYSTRTGHRPGGIAHLEMLNCTISGNQSESQARPNTTAVGGGIYLSIFDYSSTERSTAKISHCTITENSVISNPLAIYPSNRGGGLFVGNSLPLAPPLLDLNHNIIAGNSVGNQLDVATDMSEYIDLNGYNIIGIKNGITGSSVGDRFGTLTDPLDPLLCSLEMNGGTTPTHALKPASPAINSGSPNSTILVDQRDSSRIGKKDIGAFEYNPYAVGPYSIAGKITKSDGSPLPNTRVLLIAYEDLGLSIFVFDSTYSDQGGYYSFQGNGPLGFAIKAIPDSAAHPMEIPTYFDSAFVISASKFVLVCEDDSVNFRTIAGANPGGAGFIGGKITDGANRKTGESLEGISVLLVDSATQKVAAYGDTDVNGNFLFPNLALSTYQVWIDKPFFDNSLAPTFTLTSQDFVLEKLKFELQTTWLEWVGVVEGLDPRNLWDENSYTLYPNPASKTVSFKWEANTFGENIEIKLYEATGKLVKRVYVNESGQLQISLQNLSAGLYLYSVSHREEIKAIGKLMVR